MSLDEMGSPGEAGGLDGPHHCQVHQMNNETKKDLEQTAQIETEAAQRGNATEMLTDKTQGLDFSKLDLTVERVDERLSPSETNIFDK